MRLIDGNSPVRKIARRKQKTGSIGRVRVESVREIAKDRTDFEKSKS
jgi:hypothetical protein